jgi:hypothetical protein
MINDLRSTMNEIAREMVAYLTSSEFNREHATEIGERFNDVINGEIQLLREKPQLYILPPGATMEAPKLGGELDDMLMEEWNKFHTLHQDPKRFTIIEASGKDNPLSYLKYDCTLPGLLNGDWTLHYMCLDGVHMPLRLHHYGIHSYFAPKPDKMSEEDITQLTLIFASAFGEDIEDEEEARKGIKIHNKMEQAKEILPLNCLRNDPMAFCDLFGEMEVRPYRLMTDEELNQWCDMARSVMNKRYEVGIQGYGSHMFIEGCFDFNMGLHLKEYDIYPDGSPIELSRISFPVQIKEGDNALGSQMGVIHFFSRGNFVRLEHSSSELEYFNYQKRIESR